MSSQALPVFKPEWAFMTPEGFHDQEFVVDFTFTIPGNGSFVRGLPWSNDDDVPFIIRGIQFYQVGTAPLSAGLGQASGFVRIWEPHGNPLSMRGQIENSGPEYLDLALANGVWSQSGFSEINGFGFPLEPEVECPPGSAIIFDFQLNTNAFPGNLVVVSLDLAGALELVSGVIGTLSNSITFQAIDPGAPNVPLSIALVGGLHVQVTLATNGASAITSTMADVLALINNNAALIPAPAPNGAFPIMFANLLTGPADLFPVTAQTSLHNGAAASTPITISGSLLGVKRFQGCI